MPLKTLVLGASSNPERYSNKAIKLLSKYGHPVVAIGNKEDKVDSIQIHTGFPEFKDVDTVTLYLGPSNQNGFYNYILQCKPRRIIFNPGTLNPELISLAKENGILVIEACTLVMLNTGQFEMN